MGKSWFAGLLVSDMLMEGVCEVIATCPECGKSWTAPIAFLPPATSMSKIAELIVCPLCGSLDVHVEPVLQGEKLTIH